MKFMNLTKQTHIQKKNKNKQIGPWVQGTRLLVPFISLIPL